MHKAKTRSDSVCASSPSLEDIQRLITESENRLLSRLDSVSQRLASIEATLESVSNTMGTSSKELRDVLTEERQELRTIKETFGAGCRWKDGIIAELPAALAQSRRLEKAAESTSHEVIAMGLPEDTDLQSFFTESSSILNCCPPSGAQRIGRPGSFPRLVCLSFNSSSDARAYRLSATKARRENKINFRTRPSFPKELRPKLRVAASLNRAADDDTSYSVREDGQIWKFVRSDDNKWIRDAAWCESTVDVDSILQEKVTDQQGN